MKREEIKQRKFTIKKQEEDKERHTNPKNE